MIINKTEENDSQLSDVVEHLNKYKTITSKEAFKKYGITRLSSIIHILRNKNYNISTEIAYVKNRHGNLTHFAIYHLEKEYTYE